TGGARVRTFGLVRDLKAVSKIRASDGFVLIQLQDFTRGHLDSNPGCWPMLGHGQLAERAIGSGIGPNEPSLWLRWVVAFGHDHISSRQQAWGLEPTGGIASQHLDRLVNLVIGLDEG